MQETSPASRAYHNGATGPTVPTAILSSTGTLRRRLLSLVVLCGASLLVGFYLGIPILVFLDTLQDWLLPLLFAAIFLTIGEVVVCMLLVNRYDSQY